MGAKQLSVKHLAVKKLNEHKLGEYLALTFKTFVTTFYKTVPIY